MVDKEMRTETNLLKFLLPIILPLAIVGAIEIYNKLLVGSIIRPWIAVYEDRAWQD